MYVVKYVVQFKYTIAVFLTASIQKNVILNTGSSRKIWLKNRRTRKIWSVFHEHCTLLMIFYLYSTSSSRGNSSGRAFL